MNIYEKMLKITEELAPVAKNLEVKFGTKSYKAVSETDVLKPVKELEVKYGVYSYPVSRTIVDRGTTVNSNGNTSLFMRIETEYRFVNVEKPEEQISVVTYGDGLDTRGQGSTERR